MGRHARFCLLLLSTMVVGAVDGDSSYDTLLLSPRRGSSAPGTPTKTAPSAPSLKSLAAMGTNGVAGLQHLTTSMQHSKNGDDILASVASGDGFDVPLNSLITASGDVPPATITSIRGPNVPQTQSLGPSTTTASKIEGATPTLDKRTLPSPKMDEKAKMEKAWQQFVAKKGNKLPPLEEEANRVAPHSVTHSQTVHSEPLKEGSNELASKAMEEYDTSARRHGLNDPHRKYLQTVQTLRNNAISLNRNALPSVYNNAKHAIQDGVRSVDASHVPHDGGKRYKPHEEHFGYSTPLDFVDSFDPYAATSGSTSSNTPLCATHAPPLAAMPKHGVPGGELESGVGPAPLSSGRKGDSKGAGSDLASKILETTPTFQYTKIDINNADSDTKSLPGSGLLPSDPAVSSRSARARGTLPPIEGPFGADATVMMKPLPSISNAGSINFGISPTNGGGLQTPAPPLPTIPGQAGQMESAADEAVNAFAARSQLQQGLGIPSVANGGNVGPVRRRFLRR